MVIKCPKCDNEIFRPYTYCTACSWTATEKDTAKMKKLAANEEQDKLEDLETKRKKMTKDYLKREKEKGRPVPPKKESKYDKYDIDDDDFKEIFGDFDEQEEEKEDKPTEGIKFPCKCGNMIKVISPKRPIRISCPKCGASGTLKKDPPNAKKYKIGGDDEERPSDGKEGLCPECGADAKGAKFCPECGGKMPKKEPKAQKPPPPAETCPKCGAEAKGVKFCIDCGAKITRGEGGEDRPPGMPTKGKCSHCQMTNLKFLPDGRGKCPDCGHKFRWDKKKENGPSSEANPPLPDRRPPRCRSCKNRTEWIEEYKRFYCPDCNLYV